MNTELAAAFLAGLFGLIPFLAQITSIRAQRRDRMTRLNHLRAELELLERLNTLQGEVSGGDEAAMHEINLFLNNSLRKLVEQYNTLSELTPRAVVGAKQLEPRELSFGRRALLLYDPNTALGWLLHTVFYILCLFIVMFFVLAVAVPPYDLDYFIGWAIIATPLGLVLLIIQRLARRHTVQLEEPAS